MIGITPFYDKLFYKLHKFTTSLKSLLSIFSEFSVSILAIQILSLIISGNGKVDFQEFLSLIVPSKPETCREEELLEAFAAFDTDGNGYISREELKAGLEVIGETVTDEELSDLIKIIDSDDDGEIRYTGIHSLHDS